MDVILKVLEGAKTGTKIAVKKDEFLIGRSQKCHLCAGSSSVSRRHCAIRRKDTTVSIKDLSSRNGTLVNDKKITGRVELSSGDEIGIGTLKLQLTITHGITNLKRPKVKNVAEAIDRAATTGDSTVGEEDITQWLLDGPGPGPSSPSQAVNETQTIHLDDTNAIELKKELEKHSEPNSATEEKSAAESNAEELPESETEDSSKKKNKNEPGKLPKIPQQAGSKDSREAAMEALRNFNRRR